MKHTMNTFKRILVAFAVVAGLLVLVVALDLPHGRPLRFASMPYALFLCSVKGIAPCQGDGIVLSS